MSSKLLSRERRACPFRVPTNKLTRVHLLLKRLIHQIRISPFQPVRGRADRGSGRYSIVKQVTQSSAVFSFAPERTCLPSEDLTDRRHIFLNESGPLGAGTKAELLHDLLAVLLGATRVDFHFPATVLVHREVSHHAIPILFFRLLTPVLLRLLDCRFMLSISTLRFFFRFGTLLNICVVVRRRCRRVLWSLNLVELIHRPRGTTPCAGSLS